MAEARGWSVAREASKRSGIAVAEHWMLCAPTPPHPAHADGSNPFFLVADLTSSPRGLVVCHCKVQANFKKKKTRPAPSESLLRRASSPSRDSQTVPAPFPHAHSLPLRFHPWAAPTAPPCALRRAPLLCWPLLCSCFHIQAPAPRPHRHSGNR